MLFSKSWPSWRLVENLNHYVPDKTGTETISGSWTFSASLSLDTVSLTDGVTEPGTVAGKAFLYVDTADGDLKVKFGDGTVKTIVTDT